MVAPNHARRFETFVTWHLRFNGYFTVPAFVVHAGDDPTRISDGVVAPKTEVDSLAVRLPYSREESGAVFPLHRALVDGSQGRFDIVIAETKSGKGNSPNATWWQEQKVSNIAYVLRYIGWFENEKKINDVSREIQKNYRYETQEMRIRYIVFSKEIDRTWSKKGVQYITFADCIDFLADRGECWQKAKIGSRSVHDQWDPLMKDIFQIANNLALDRRMRHDRIWGLLNASNRPQSK